MIGKTDMEEIAVEKKSADKPFSGKKPKPPLRQKRLNIRFSDAEFSLVESKANGMSLARYARAILTTGYVPRRERDFPTVDPKLLREIRSLGRNVNQLVRYIHTEANTKRSIDSLNLALAIDRFSSELAELKQQYQVQSFPQNRHVQTNEDGKIEEEFAENFGIEDDV